MRRSLCLLLPFVLASASLCGAQTKLLVGFSEAQLAPEHSGLPLAGYGAAARRAFPFLHRNEYATWFKASNGTHDPVRVKTMVLLSGSKKLVFISLDLAAVTVEMYQDLARVLTGLGYERDAIFISATHTHSGPGTLSDRFLWEALAADRFQQGYYATVRERVATSVAE